MYKSGETTVQYFLLGNQWFAELNLLCETAQYFFIRKSMVCRDYFVVGNNKHIFLQVNMT